MPVYGTTLNKATTTTTFWALSEKWQIWAIHVHVHVLVASFGAFLSFLMKNGNFGPFQWKFQKYFLRKSNFGLGLAQIPTTQN